MTQTTPSHEQATRTNHKRRLKGLRRPRRPLSFQIDTIQLNTQEPLSKHHSTPPSPSSSENALEKRILLLNLLVRRNKNQHRAQLFFKHLCLLRSSLVRLLAIISRLTGLSQSVVATTTTTSEHVRRNFEVEANLRSRKDVLEEHVREVLVPQCYVSFSGLVGDSQFGNLGVMLVALLGEIACGRDGVGVPEVVQDEREIELEGGNWHGRRLDWSGSLLGTSTRITGEDQGEVVERMYDRNVSIGNEPVPIIEAGERHQPSAEDEGTVGSTAPKTNLPKASHDLPSHSKVADMVDSDPEKAEREASRTARKNEIEGGGGRKSKKNKKSKNAIDDLFSGLL